MSRLITDFLATLILPPAAPLLVIAAALMLLARRRKLVGLVLAWAGVALAWISSTEIVGGTLVRMIEPPAADAAQIARGQAIVVLGGGRVIDSPEYREDVASKETLARLRYAAQLARSSALPVLVTGGKPYSGTLTEGEAMKRALEAGFNVPVRWVESVSRTTAENARGAYGLLAPENRTRIVLVTSAVHMPRAERAFRKAGFEVVAAPTGYVSRRPVAAIDFLPTESGLRRTREALWEWLGMLWYRLRGDV